MTWHCPSLSTVTGTCSPASVNTRVIPIFCAITPERIFLLVLDCAFLRSPSAGHADLELDLHVDTGRKVELHQSIDGLRRGIDDVEQALVRAHFELLAALLVDVRRAVHGEFFNLGRQRNRSPHLRTRALGGRHNLTRRRIENAVIVSLEPDADVL